MLVSCKVYSSTMKMKATYFSGTLVALRGQYGIIYQKIELFRFLIEPLPGN
jgi:hypothetical protein